MIGIYKGFQDRTLHYSVCFDMKYKARMQKSADNDKLDNSVKYAKFKTLKFSHSLVDLVNSSLDSHSVVVLS